MRPNALRITMTPLLIYIHGFKSSPLSEKAQEVRRYIESRQLDINYQVPALSDYPDESFLQLTQLVEANLSANPSAPIALIGSSMGGFMATALAERYPLKAVLVNPAVRPSELIGSVLGINENPYTGHRFVLEQRHVEALRALEAEAPGTPQNLLLMVQTGDETLDYRRAVDYYRGCAQVVEEGGDHRFQHFDRHLPAVFTFLGLQQAER